MENDGCSWGASDKGRDVTEDIAEGDVQGWCWNEGVRGHQLKPASATRGSLGVIIRPPQSLTAFSRTVL